MAAAQIIIRDTTDGRLEVTVMNTGCTEGTQIRGVLAVMLAALGGIADVRTIGAGVASGRPVVRDVLLIAQQGDTFTLSGIDVEPNVAQVRGLQ